MRRKRDTIRDMNRIYARDHQGGAKMDEIKGRWRAIRALMGALNLDQRKLAPQIGINPSSLSWLLNEQRIDEHTAHILRWLVDRYREEHPKDDLADRCLAAAEMGA